MTLKAIELQVALPRTGEIGLLQNQLTHKPMDDQQALANQLAKKAQEDMKRSQDVDKTSTLLVGEDDDGRQDSSHEHTNPRQKRNMHKQKGAEVEHPYKGHHIDLSL